MKRIFRALHQKLRLGSNLQDVAADRVVEPPRMSTARRRIKASEPQERAALAEESVQFPQASVQESPGVPEEREV
jgi:hypothetical protein